MGPELGKELGLQARRFIVAQGLPVFVESGLDKPEEVLQYDDVPFHFLDFRDVGNLIRS